MIDKNTLLDLINLAISGLDKYVNDYQNGNIKDTEADLKNIFIVFYKDVDLNYPRINERLLRGWHDLGFISVRDYSDTDLGIAMDKIYAFLRINIPQFRNVSKLGMEWGKGDPI